MGQYIRNFFDRYKKIIVWGTGNFFTVYKDLLDECFSYFVDNNAEKWGTILDHKIIFSPEHLRKEKMDETLVIVCNHYVEEVLAQVRRYGNFDIIDIITVCLVKQKEKELTVSKSLEASHCIAVCGGIHAMWQMNGSRKFIDGQLEQLHQSGFQTLEIIPLLYFQAGMREPVFWAISANGIYQGLFRSDSLVKFYPKIKGMIIHSLYYNWNTIETLLESFTVETRVLYYIHDYACLCTHRFLYKDKKLCIDAEGKMVCNTCSADEERRRLLHFYQALFEKYKVLMIAPSADAKARVEPFYKHIEIAELPHLDFEQETCVKQVNSRIRIAYIGVCSWSKGWEQFAMLVDRFRCKYEFYCLGDCPDDLKIKNVWYVPVALKESEHVPRMTEALLQYGIDIAYIGSVWPETYSFTYYEVYEAGCFVLTNAQSGNVYKQVTVNRNGFAFSSNTEMMEWLEKGMVRRDIQSINKKIKNVENSKAFLKYFDKV